MITFKCKTTQQLYRCTKDKFQEIKMAFYNKHGFSVLFDNYFEIIKELQGNKPIKTATPIEVRVYHPIIKDNKSNYPPIY